MASIYVASLSDYNNGHMHGAWIELDDKGVEDVQVEIAGILRTSKHPNVTVPCPDCEDERDSQRCRSCNGTGTIPSAEEWAIHDYDVPGMDVKESTPLADIVEHLEKVEEHGDAWIAYALFCGDIGDTPSDSSFQNCQAGTADSELEWCEQFLDDTGFLSEIPENQRYYFDTERYLRDMKLGGDVDFVEHDGTTYAFWNH